MVDGLSDRGDQALLRPDRPSAQEFTAMLADGYYACAREPVDMVAATNALEAIRTAGERNPELFPIRRELNDQVGRAEEGRLRDVLVTLRDRHQSWLTAAHREWANDATYVDWVTRFAQAFEAWSLDVCEALLVRTPSPPPEEAEIVQKLPETIARMLQDDWDRAGAAFEWLARHQAVPVDTRARILARLAQVALYFDDDPEAGLAILEEALALPIGRRARAEVESARGQCLMRQGDASAAAVLERAAELDPRFVESFGYRGDLARESGDLTTAELWYRRAIAAHSGSSVGYLHLVKLYCRPELASARAHEVDRILSHADAVDPSGAAANRATGAENLRDCGLLDLAERQAEHAVERGPERGRAYYVRGTIRAMQERWREALEDFRRARSLEPTKYESARFPELGTEAALPFLVGELERTPDDYVARDAVFCFVQQAQGDEARTRVALEALSRLDDVLDATFSARIANERGDLFYYGDDFARAAEEFGRAWKLEQLAVHGANVVAALRKLGRWEKAAAMVDEVFAVTEDEAWRAEWYPPIAIEHGNRLFAQGEFVGAVEAYERALRFRPDDVTYNSNHARALTGLYRQAPSAVTAERARAAWKRVLTLAPELPKHMANAEDFEDLVHGVERFGAAALEAPATVTPIRVCVGPDLLPMITTDQEGLTPELLASIEGIREWIQKDYGIQLPALLFNDGEGVVPDDRYALLLFELVARVGRAPVGMQLAVGPAAARSVSDMGLENGPATHPLSGEGAFWLTAGDAAMVRERGAALISAIDYLLFDLASVILSRLPEFLGHEELDDLLIAQGLSTDRLTPLLQVCRGLLGERVPIVALPAIVEAVNATPPSTSAGELLAQIRLLPALAPRLLGSGARPVFQLLPAEHERLLVSGLIEGAPETSLALRIADCQTLIASVHEIVDERPNVALVVRDGRLRPLLRRLLAEDFPRLIVLSESEARALDEAAEPEPLAATV